MQILGGVFFTWKTWKINLENIFETYLKHYKDDHPGKTFFFQAQAQECILEKSMTDNRKSTITAKVAAQIVEYYRLATSHLETSNAGTVIGSRRYKVRT